MANTKQAQKMIRKNKKRTEFNNWWKKRVRTSRKSALTFRSTEEAIENFAIFSKNIDKAVKHNIIPFNRANRQKSKLNLEINKKLQSLK